MKKIVTLCLLFAFVFAASGLHKHVSVTTPSLAASSMSTTQAPVDMAKCCASQNEESETHSPRCLGDNCLSSVILPTPQIGFGDKLRFAAPIQLDALHTSSFLRPPIV